MKAFPITNPVTIHISGWTSQQNRLCAEIARKNAQQVNFNIAFDFM